MKRKYISMMLLGVSVSLVTPSIAAFAEEPMNIESGDMAGDKTVEPGASEESATGDIEKSTEETIEAFADKLPDVTFRKKVFGNLASDLTLLLAETSAEGLTLKEYEEKIFEEVSKMGLENSLDVQYYVATAFEEIYGDAAEEAGRAMRYRYMSEKTGTDFTAEFEEMDSYSLYEVDALMSAVAGTPVRPADAEKDAFAETSESVSPEEAEFFVEDGQEEDPELNPNMEILNESETDVVAEINLEDYVEGIGDISIVVGESVPTSYNNLDPSIVADVKWDLSQVEPNEEGVYPIYVTIYGVDGTTAGPFEYICTVNVDTQLLSKKEQMKKLLDEIDSSMLEGSYATEWSVLVEEAKAQIDAASTEEEMQNVVDNMAAKKDELVSRQELAKAKTARKTEIQTYFNGLSFKTDALQAMGEDALSEILSKIESCTSITELDSIIRDGKAKLDSIVNMTEETLDDLKANAKTDISSMKKDSATGTKMDDMLESVCINKIDNAKDADEISKVLNTSRAIFAKLKEYKSDKSQIAGLLREMKGLTADVETTQLFDEMAKQAIPATDKDAEDIVADACKSLTVNTDDFIAYLSGKTGENISGTTKAEAYKNYVEFLKNGGTEEKEKLEREKAAAKDRIQAMVGRISDVALRSEAQKAADIAYEQLETAQKTEEVSSIEAKAKEKIESLVNISDEKEKVQKAKGEAISQIDKILREQQDSPVYGALHNMADTAKKNINNAISVDQIELLLSSFSADVSAVVKEQTSELANAKSEALGKLSALMTAYNSKYVTSEAQNVIDQAKRTVENAKTSAECSEAYNSAKESFDKACLQSMKDSFSNELNDLLNNSYLEEDDLSAAKAIVSKAIENINKIASPNKENVMQAIYAQAKAAVGEIVENASTAGEDLEKAKEDAKKELENYVTNVTSNSSKVVSTYKNKIDSAKTKEEVSKRLEEAKKLLDQIGAHTSNAPSINNNTNTTTTSSLVNDPNATVEDVRMAALSELKAYVTNNSDNAEEIVKKYSDSIKNATSKEKIDDLLQEAKAKLDAIGAHDEKVGEKRGEPEEKSVSTLAVKTGDVNDSVFAMLFSAIASSLGLIGAVVFKKSRQ